MAARVRAFDWSRTPLGPMGRWPLILRTTVRDTNDFMDGEDFIYFEAEVEKASRTGSPRPKANMGNTVSIGGSVYGALQVGAAHSSQSVNVSVDQQFTSSLRLSCLVSSSTSPSSRK